MPKSSRDANMVQECLNLMSDLYFAPTFCISYKKNRTTEQEFFPLSKKDECFARIRELRVLSGITCLSCLFHFHLEVYNI